MERAEKASWLAGMLAVFCLALTLISSVTPTRAASLHDFIGKVAPSELVPGADAYGPIRSDMPAAPALKGGTRIGWVFLKLGTAYRLATGGDFAHKLLGLGQTVGAAFANFTPGLAPFDWLVGIVGQWRSAC